MQLFDRPDTAGEVRSAPPLPAHRRLVEAMLCLDEPGPAALSYVELWREAAAEQRDLHGGSPGVHAAGEPGGPHESVERALEMLVTELRALSRAVPWFAELPALREAAITETIAHWAGYDVASRPAHAAWRRCWQARSAAVRRVPAGAGDLAACVAAEQRMQADWAREWHRWARLRGAALPGSGQPPGERDLGGEQL